MPRYLSNRVKRTPQSGLSTDRYRYLDLEQAEPNLGDPEVPGETIPVGTQYQVISLLERPGERYWIPVGGGLIPGSITVYDEGIITPPGGVSSISQLNFVGTTVSAKGYLNPNGSPGIAVTITVSPPGNNGEVLFKENNDFATSSSLVFNSSVGILTIGNGLNVGSGGSIFTVKPTGLVGIGTTNPTQELHLQGDLRLTGTIYDYLNNPGSYTQVLLRNNFGGVEWEPQGKIRAGAGGTYQQVQYHNAAGLVDGALIFVYDDVNNRVGIGSTQPKVLLDVLGISSFKGGTSIDNLIVTGVTTTSTLAVSGTSTTRNLLVTGVTTVGFVTGTSAFFTGIVTARKFVGELNTSDLYVTGISTFLQKVNINSDLGVTGLTTTQNLQVYQSTTLNRLNVSGVSTFTSQVNINNLNVTGVGTFDNIKLDTNTISTNVGNLILNSDAGTTQIDDAIYVNDSTESTSKDGGSIVTEGGVGIEKNLNVGGQLSIVGVTTLASAGGITTTGGDLYVKGDLYVSDDIFYDELFARNGFFTGIVSTRDLTVTGISTFLQKVNINSDLGVTGLTTTQNLQVYQLTTLNRLNTTGVSTFTSQVNINNLNVTGVGTFDNIKLDTNTISTNVGDLILDSAGTTQINDIVYVTSTLESTSKDTGSIVTEGGVGIEKNLNVGGQLNVVGATTLASAGGITTTGGDLYVKGDLYVSDDIFYDELFARNGFFTGIVSTRDLNVTGVATIATLGVTGLTTTRNLIVSGISTFNGLLDANAGATIDNIQIGITGDNEIDTSTGNLTIDSAGGTTTIDDQLIVSGISTFNGNVVFGDSTADTVSFTSRVGTGITPSTNGTLDLGGISNKWNNVYANTFSGQFIGNADTASQVSTGTTTGTITYYPTFVDSNNPTRGNEFLYTDAGISYNPSTDLLTAGNLGVTGLTTTRNLIVSGISTFNGLLDANAGATIDNIQIGITGDNEIDTSTGNLTIDSAGGTTTIDDQLIVSGISTFQGNVTIGDVNTDKVSFGATVDSNIIPSGTTRDLGSVANKWNNVYANTFVGAITGNADTATKLQTPRSIAATNDITWSVVFDGSTNVSSGATLKDSGVAAGTYGSATQVGIVTVDAKGRITSASNVNINFGAATVESANRLTTPREIDISGDVIGVGIGTTFDGSKNVTIPTELSTTGVAAGTYGSATQVGIVTVDAKGRITSASNVNINFGAATVAQSDTVKTISSTLTTLYPTFVDSNNVTAAYEAVYTDAGISYNASTDLLRLTNVTVSGIATFNGAVDLGNAAADTISINGNVDTSIIPSTTSLDLGSTTQKWDIIYANSIIGNVTGAASSLSVTTDSADASRRIVLSSVTSGISTVLADGNLLYNPSTNLLTVPNIRPTAIQDTGGGTGGDNFVLTSNGTGGWTWKVASTSGGSAAIGGITVQDEGSTVGTAAGITTVNFVGADITATASGATATITLTTTAAAAAGEAAGTAAGTTAGTTAGTAAGTTAGTAAGTAAGTTAGTAAGTTAGTAAATGVLNATGSANQVLYKNASNVATTSPNFTFDGTNVKTLGNIIINNTAPSVFLQDTDHRSCMLHCNSNSFFVLRGDGINSLSFETSNGYWPLQINLDNNDALFGRNLSAIGDIIAYSGSDERLKDNITPIPNALDKVLSISGNTFDWNEKSDHEGNDVGVIAQEILEVLPEAVTTRDTGYLAVRYEKIIPLLIEAIKEQQETITNLQNRIELLEGK